MPQMRFKHTSNVPQTRVKFLLHFTRAANLLHRKRDLPPTSRTSKVTSLKSDVPETWRAVSRLKRDVSER